MWTTILAIITSVCICGLDSDDFFVREDSVTILNNMSFYYDVRPQLKAEILKPQSLESKRRTKDLVRTITVRKLNALVERRTLAGLPTIQEMQYPSPNDIDYTCNMACVYRRMTVQEYINANIQKKTLEQILEELEEKDVSP